MKKTIAALMSLTVACAMFTPAFAAETESPAPISEPPAVLSETPEETAGRYTFEINGEDVSVDAVDLEDGKIVIHTENNVQIKNHTKKFNIGLRIRAVHGSVPFRTAQKARQPPHGAAESRPGDVRALRGSLAAPVYRHSNWSSV